MNAALATHGSDIGGGDHRARTRSWLLVAFIAAEVVAILVLSLVAGLDPFWTPVQVWLVSAYGLGGAFLVRRQPGNTVGWILWAIGASLVPIAIGISVTRYRLYDIDRIVGRTVGWAIITVLLVAVFGGLVIGLQALLAGVTQGQTLAVAVSTLAAFAVFQPLRRRVQGTGDRRFDRTRCDAQRTVESFAERLRGEVDLIEIQHAMVDTVQVAVRPMREAVWLRSVTE